MENEKRWMCCEVSRTDWEKLRIFLKKNGIKYEPSECYTRIHVEVFVNNLERDMIDQFIDTL